MYSTDGKAEFSALTSVSHDPSQIIPICRFSVLLIKLIKKKKKKKKKKKTLTNLKLKKQHHSLQHHHILNQKHNMYNHIKSQKAFNIGNCAFWEAVVTLWVL